MSVAVEKVTHCYWALCSLKLTVLVMETFLVYVKPMTWDSMTCVCVWTHIHVRKKACAHTYSWCSPGQMTYYVTVIYVLLYTVIYVLLNCALNLK